MKLTEKAFKNFQICIFFVLNFLWLYMLKRRDFQDLWVAFLCYYGISTYEEEIGDFQDFLITLVLWLYV
jgi:hypothetical protein